MARRSYSGEKRRKELARKAKQEAKRQKKIERKRVETESPAEGADAGGPEPTTPPEPAEPP